MVSPTPSPKHQPGSAHNGHDADVAIVGAGAAGLVTALFVRRLAPHARVLLIEGAKRPGAKILVSGGGRCNVTNARVTDADYWGGRRTTIRHVLRAFTVAETRQLFADLGVALVEEAHGKLFPASGRARDVLEALLSAAAREGVTLLAGARVSRVDRDGAAALRVTAAGQSFHVPHLVMAAGGQSLPKSGSDGHGYAMARALGHSIVPTTPALVPLLLGTESPHRALQGVAHQAEITCWVDQQVSQRCTGALLWTHFGISGPVALDISRHWARATLERRETRLTLSFVPGEPFDVTDARLRAEISAKPKSALATLLSAYAPASVAGVLARAVDLDANREAGTITREARRALAHALTASTLPVVGTRGFTFAEVTAGGVPLDEVETTSLASKVCPGLWFAGEILDVDGRLGGFNFQWAWSSAVVVARAIARQLTTAHTS